MSKSGLSAAQQRALMLFIGEDQGPQPVHTRDRIHGLTFWSLVDRGLVGMVELVPGVFDYRLPPAGAGLKKKLEEG